MVRDDLPDLIYKSEDAKFDALADEIKERYDLGQPVLVGTISVEKSEHLARPAREAPGSRARGAERQAARAQEANDRHAGRSGRRVSRSPPTWPAAASTSSSAAIPEGLAAQREVLAEGVDLDAVKRDPAKLRRSSSPKYKEHVHQGRGRSRARARRALRARHRTPREPAHRQPAARPRRTSGRPGRQPVLPLARRRTHAPVRDRRDAVGDGPSHSRRHAARGARWSPRRSSARSTPSRIATSRSARTSSSTTRS